MSFSFPSLIYDQQSKSRNNLRNLELFRNLFLSRQLPITFKKKKEKMIPNLLRRPLEQRVPYQNERNDPLESPILSFFLSRGSEKKRDAQNRGERERKSERIVRNAPCSNRFSSGARSSRTKQTLTSADASQQSNSSRENSGPRPRSNDGALVLPRRGSSTRGETPKSRMRGENGSYVEPRKTEL